MRRISYLTVVDDSVANEVFEYLKKLTVKEELVQSCEIFMEKEV